jgi:hypothetical protein
MGMIIGPTPWWQLSLISTCPVGTTLPDGSRIICKEGGTAWIVAPNCTQVSQTWNGTTTLLVGNKPCVSDWATLNTQLLNCGFNPADWFVPSSAQLFNPGYTCRTKWDTFSSATFYWSSTESSAATACNVDFGNGNTRGCSKADAWCVRAFRCVTY